MIIIACALIWWLVGIASFIFWHTTDDDYKTSNIVPSLLFGVIGPLMFIIGWLVYVEEHMPNTVLIRNRRKKK